MLIELFHLRWSLFLIKFYPIELAATAYSLQLRPKFTYIIVKFQFVSKIHDQNFIRFRVVNFCSFRSVYTVVSFSFLGPKLWNIIDEMKLFNEIKQHFSLHNFKK